MRGYRPQVVLATGGYVTRAGGARRLALARVPSLIFLPDMPGRVWRCAFWRASPQDQRSLSTRRGSICRGKDGCHRLSGAQGVIRRRAGARPAQRLGLAEALPVVVVLGGSRGSRSINEAVRAAWPQLLPVCQVLHVAGVQDEPWLRRRRRGCRPSCGRTTTSSPTCTTELPDALGAADVVVSRAGASVMGEYPGGGRAERARPLSVTRAPTSASTRATGGGRAPPSCSKTQALVARHAGPDGERAAG